MDSLPELSLDLKPSHPLKTITGFLREASMIGDSPTRLLKIEGFLKCLEEERRKVEAFKRELPFCILLMNDAIDAVKKEEMQCRSSVDGKSRLLLEEFMPIKSKIEEGSEDSGIEKDGKDKMNWMSSAQLWSDTSEDERWKKKNLALGGLTETSKEPGRLPFEILKGDFYPLKGVSGFSTIDRKEEVKEVIHPIPGLSLLCPEIKSSNADSGASSLNSKSSSRTSGSASAQNVHPNLQQQQQPQQQQQHASRKARRCWSPELHRRFVGALQQLGGSQVATPKQIRELMKVDGLTNDEVKSHLQKYRLHTRRVPNSTPTGASQQVFVMGRLWTHPDHHYQASKQNPSQSGSPQGPLQLSGSCRAISIAGCDSGEEEDGRSESYSWKGQPLRSGEETE